MKTKEELKKFLDDVAGYMPDQVICNILNIQSKEEFEKIKEKFNPDYNFRKAELLARLAKNVYLQGLNGDFKSSQFLLKTVGGYEDTSKESVVSYKGKDANRIEQNKENNSNLQQAVLKIKASR